MKLLFIKNLCLTNGIKAFTFKRMTAYNLPDQYAQEIIKEGYAVEFGFLSELPLTTYNYNKQITIEVIK